MIIFHVSITIINIIVLKPFLITARVYTSRNEIGSVITLPIY